MHTAGSEHLATVLGSQAAHMQEEQLSSLSRGLANLAESQDGFAATVTAQLGNLPSQIQQLLGATHAERAGPSAPEMAPVPTLAHAPSELHLSVSRGNRGAVSRSLPSVTCTMNSFPSSSLQIEPRWVHAD